MRDAEMKIKVLTKEAMGDIGVTLNKSIQSASSDIKSAIEAAYFTGYNDGKKDARNEGRKVPITPSWDTIEEILIRT